MTHYPSALQPNDGFQKKKFRISGRSSTNFLPPHWFKLLSLTDEVNAEVLYLPFHSELSHSQEQF